MGQNIPRKHTAQFQLSTVTKKKPISGIPTASPTLQEKPRQSRYVQRAASPQMYRYDLTRSEEHTSELQSHSDLVCRLLLEKKKRPNKQQGAEKPRSSLRESKGRRTSKLAANF